MATAAGVQPNSDWPLSNPWPWLLAGVTALAGGFLWMRLAGADGTPVRGLLLCLGLLAVGVGLCLRWRSGDVSFLSRLSPSGRQRALLGLVLFFALLAVGVTVLLVGNALGTLALPWETSELVWLWLAVAPWSAAWVLWCVQGRAAGAVSARAEGAALLTLAAFGLFLACWALYDPQQPLDWDSGRLVLGVGALAAYVGGVIAAGSTRVRKILVSALILLHLGAIATAVTAAQPGPYLAAVVWSRFYGPYLEFMYLNNAYRFYSPEPAPSWQIWYRVEYHDGKGHVESHWIIMPDIDKEGKTNYALQLQFQRRLMHTEHLRTTPVSLRPRIEWGLSGIPNHPDPTVSKGQEPEVASKLALASFARYVTALPHPTKPNLKASAVKIYRVQHRMIQPTDLIQGRDPKDLTLYLPYYMGKYSADGTLLDPNDPYLYCLLPTVRENWNDPNSPILIYAFKHAGDVNDWVRQPKGGTPLRQPLGPPGK